MEETGEVELEQRVSLVECGVGEEGRTDEASSAREMVCWARVMVVTAAAFSGSWGIGEEGRLDCKDREDVQI